MSGYCPDCGNQQCMCKEIEARKNECYECQHIYGYYDGDPLESGGVACIYYEKMHDSWYDIKFIFCPLCGVRLSED